MKSVHLLMVNALIVELDLLENFVTHVKMENMVLIVQSHVMIQTQTARSVAQVN
jgi:hypothetical protein